MCVRGISFKWLVPKCRTEKKKKKFYSESNCLFIESWQKYNCTPKKSESLMNCTQINKLTY